MFGMGKKEKQEKSQPVVINPNEASQFPGLPSIPYSQPEIPQQEPVQQPVQPVQQPVQQQVQQSQEVQPIAYIKQVTVVEPGIFQYVIEANYPLVIGNCVVQQ